MSHQSSPRLLTLHALRLKGIAEADAVAAMMDVAHDEATAELAQLEAVDLITYRHGRIPGWVQTPDGRAHGDRLLAEELETTGTRPAIEAAYADFRGCNGDLLGVCTAWQLRDVDGTKVRNDHTDSDYDAGVCRWLVEVHAKIDPVLDDLAAALTRFRGHQRRLATALDRVLAGDHQYFTTSMFPSYHSTWFELHEDLLATLGTERATEEVS